MQEATEAYRSSDTDTVKSKIEEFWRSRKSKGDPIAVNGLNFLNANPEKPHKNIIANFLNNRIQKNYSNANPNQHLDFNEVRIELMKKHIEYTDNDNRGVPGLLNPRQATEYHHKVFESYGLPKNTFGGTMLSGSLWEADLNRVFWCHKCDLQ